MNQFQTFWEYRKMDSDDDRLEIAEDNPPTPAGQQHQSSLNTKTFVANKPWRQQQSEAAMSSNADAVESLLMLSGMGSPTHHQQPGPPDHQVSGGRGKQPTKFPA